MVDMKAVYHHVQTNFPKSVCLKFGCLTVSVPSLNSRELGTSISCDTGKGLEPDDSDPPLDILASLQRQITILQVTKVSSEG